MMHPAASPEVLESRIAPSVFLVTSATDSAGATADDGTLRGEILAANAHPGADTIKFASDITVITLTAGALDITRTMLIDGPGSPILLINGDGSHGIFSVGNSASGTTFDGLTLHGGVATSVADEIGGAISSSVSITVENCALMDNTATNGGAIGFTPAAGKPSLTLSNSQLSGNIASDDGGAVFVSGIGGSATVTGSTFVTNTADEAGGALLFQDPTGSLVISKSTFESNTVKVASPGVGGAIFAGGASIQILDSNILNNQAKVTAGGAYLAADEAVTKIVISGSSFASNSTGNNTSDTAGGLLIESAGNSSTVNIRNTTILANSSLGSVGGLALNGGSFALNGVTVGQNTSNGPGPGIVVNGNVSIVSSSVILDTTSNAGGGGGGIDIQSGSHAGISSSHILGNSVTGADSKGGGIYDAGTGGSLTISSSVISQNNSVAAGGGLFLAGGGAGSVPLSISNSTISANQSSGDGGGLEDTGTSPITFLSDSFVGNLAGLGAGGAFLSTSAAMHLTNTSFIANNAPEGVGGLDIGGAAGGTLLISGGHFSQNQGFDTGGLSIVASVTGIVKSVSITDNVSLNDSTGAGGFSAESSITLLASTISGNVNVLHPVKSNTYGDFKT